MGARVWPGALGATLAIGIVDLGFPLYLDNVSTLRIGTSAVFVLIALVWFYVIALILLAGAVVNGLRFEHLSRRRRAVRLKTGSARPNTQVDSYPESSFGDEASCCHFFCGGCRFSAASCSLPPPSRRTVSRRR